MELKFTKSLVAPFGSAKEKIMLERELFDTERTVRNYRNQFVL